MSAERDDREEKEFLSGILGEEGSAHEDLDLAITVDHEGIDLHEGELPSQRKKSFDLERDEDEDVDFRITPEVLDKTSDPVRLYLREMGTVPLLTRQGEIEIAKRFKL